MDFRNFLDKLKNALGGVADRVIPGDQSSWHQPQPTVQQRNVAAAVGGGFGFGPQPQQVTQQAQTRLNNNALKVNNYVQSLGYGPAAVNTPLPQSQNQTGPISNPFLRVAEGVKDTFNQIPVLGAPVQFVQGAYDAQKNDKSLLAPVKYGVQTALGAPAALFGGLANQVTQTAGINGGTSNSLFGESKSFSNQAADEGLGKTLLNNAVNLAGTAALAADIGLKNPSARPAHQAELEAAHNAGNTTKVNQILDSIPNSDPYKQPMENLFRPQNYKTAGQVVNDTTVPLAVRKAIKSDIAEGKVTTKTQINVPTEAKVPTTRIAARGPKREAGFVTTVKESPHTPAAVADNAEGTYTQITNTDTLAAADRNINRLGYDNALHQAITSNDGGTLAQATRLRLQQNLQLEGAQALKDGNKELADAKFNQALDVLDTIRKRATENGRANQILAAYNSLTPEGIVRYAVKEMEPTGKRLAPEVQAKLTQMATDAMSLPEGPAKNLAQLRLIEEVKRQVPTSSVQRGLTIWKAGLLTGIKGAVGGNTVGNLSHALLRAASDAPSAGYDALISIVTGQRSKVFSLRALGAGLKGAGEGVQKGFLNKDSVLRTGYDLTDAESLGKPYSKYDVKKTFFSRSPLGKAAQTYTDAVFNFYAASDRPAYYFELRKSLTENAIVEAKNKGLKGAEREAFIKKTVAEPPEDILSTAVDEAQTAVFQKDTALGKGLSKFKGELAKGGALGEITGEVGAPFTGVPAAILTLFKDYSPAGAISTIIKAAKGQATQRELSTALGKSTTGAGLIYLGYKLAGDGNITLGYPTDPKEQALWQQEGKQPYSVKVDGRWRSLNYTGVGMSLLGAGAQFRQNMEQGGDIATSAATSGLQAAQAAINSSPLQGAQNLLDVVAGNNRTTPGAYVNNTTGSVVPTLVKDISNATDPTSRLVDDSGTGNVKEAIQARIPVLRTSLNPKVDQFGNEIQGQSGIGAIIDPFRSTDASTTSLTDELQRLQSSGNGIIPTEAESKNRKVTIGGQDVTLNADQLTQYQKLVGGAVSNTWGQLIATPAYKSLDNGAKNSALQRAKDAVTSAAKLEFAQQAGVGDAKKAGDLSNLASAAAMGDLTPEMLTVDPKLYSQATKLKLLQDDYSVDVALGNLSPVEAYSKLKSIQSAAKKVGTPTNAQIASNYSKDAVTLAGMSKADQAALINSGAVDPETIRQAAAYKAETDSYKTSTGGSKKITVKKAKGVPKLRASKIKASKAPKTAFKVAKAKSKKVAIPKITLANTA